MATKKKAAVTHSAQFEKYKKRYDRGGCTKEQLEQLVALGILTAAEYEEITGEPFPEN